jgi:sulfite exporter TauE/SafE
MSEPSYMAGVGLGFLLGLRHALDADHLAAVSTVLAERPSFRSCSAVGFWWGIGHTVMLLAVGTVVLGLGVRLSAEFERITEIGVGILLVTLGGNVLFKLLVERWHVHPHDHGRGVHIHWHPHRRGDDHRHPHWTAEALRPLGIGMAHGLAGLAALMLLVLTSTEELAAGLISIAVFGLGSIAGMMVVGLTISLPLVCSLSFSRQLFVTLQGLAGTVSIGVGGWMVAKQVAFS